MDYMNNMLTEGLSAFRQGMQQVDSYIPGLDNSDPMAMFFAVYTGNVQLPNEQDILTAAAEASLKAFAYYSESNWQESFDAWFVRRIRKVVKHTANNKKWNKLLREETLTDDAIVHTDNATGLSVFVSKPLRFSQVPYSLKQLQVSDFDVAATLGALTTTQEGINICVNKSLKMSTGKKAAQVAHGVQLALRYMESADFDQWVHTTCPMSVEYGFPTRRAHGRLVARVHDAGFTEIPANSETVRVYYGQSSKLQIPFL